MKHNLVQYVKRPKGPLFHDFENRDKFVRAVMKEFHGAKAKTPVEKLVKSYINNQKVGVLIAVPNNDASYVHITYAKWHEDMDFYDKDLMVDVALERLVKFAEKPDTFVPHVPFDIEEALPQFMDRCRRYFKNAKFPKWTEKYKLAEPVAEVVMPTEAEVKATL